MNYANPSLDGLRDLLTTRAARKVDRVAHSLAAPLTVDQGNGGRVHVQMEGISEAAFSTAAFGQLLTKNGVQSGFFAKCSPELKRHILDEFYDGRSMYRMWTSSGPSFPYVCRAVLGPQYPLDCDDVHLFPNVMEALLADEDANPHLFTIDDEVTELKATFTDTTASLAGNHTVTGSVAITNSETGHSAIWIEPTIQVYGNYWISRGNGDGTARYIHRGTLPGVDEIRAAVVEAKRVAQIGVIQYLEKAQDRLSNAEANKYMDNMVELPKRIGAIIQNEIKEAEYITKADLMRRIILATAHFPLIEQIQLRREVGGLVGLFKDTASRLANLANQLNQE